MGGTMAEQWMLILKDKAFLAWGDVLSEAPTVLTAYILLFMFFVSAAVSVTLRWLFTYRGITRSYSTNMTALSADERFKIFLSRGAAFPWIAFVGLSLCYFLWATSRAGWFPFNGDLQKVFVKELTPGRWLFLYYLCFFVAAWFVYFLSRDNFSLFHVRSLRSMLNYGSAQWQTTQDESNLQREYYEKKAGSVTTSMSVFVAVATIVLSTAVQMLLASANKDPWDLFCLYMAIFTSLVASISLIVSVDIMDSIYNRFKAQQVQGVILPYLYNLTINPKYAGFVLLMLSLIFLAAWISPTAGSIGLATMNLVGHTYWFPQLHKSRLLTLVRNFLFIFGCALPLVIIAF
jgi:protein-S-isoprenylcysteine O-methyltransferase Ste14